MDYKEKIIALLDSKELSKEEKEKLECILLEFAESEDERTMKELCKAIWTYIPYEQAQKYITWLEKQGEKKPTWKPTAAQLIVIKGLMEDKNTSNVDKTILRGMFEEFKQFTNSQSSQFSRGQLLDPDKVIEWLKTEWEDLGINWVRGVYADEIIDKFKKDFGL